VTALPEFLSDFLRDRYALKREPLRLLGTPANQKRYVVEDGSHCVPRTRLVQEMLAWLDRYQPVTEER
jgi:hypothetical protein